MFNNLLYVDLIQKWGYDRIVKPSGEIDKKILYETLMASVLKKATVMLRYENLPEEIPQRMLRQYLITNGHFAGFVNNGKMMISWGTFAGKLDEYYFPKNYIINNPYIEDMTGKTLKVGTECIIVKNDSMAEPLMNVIAKYVNMLTENETSMIICDILTRAQGVLSTKDDTQMESASAYLKNLFNGRIVPVNSDNFTGEHMESIAYGTAHQTLTDLIEYEQYIRSSLYSELGIRLNFNMKREALNAEETSMDEEILKPYIDNMLETQNEDLLMLSDFWGLPEPIRAVKNSVWEEMEEKEELQEEILEKTLEEPEEPEEPGEEEVQNED